MYQNCPLYAIQSKKMLLQALGIQDKRWQKHTFVQQNISPFIDGTIKKRLVEAPSQQLKIIQKRIKNPLIKGFITVTKVPLARNEDDISPTFIVSNFEILVEYFHIIYEKFIRFSLVNIY